MIEDPERRHFLEPNLGVTEAARQHFVPRFYLARFANDDLVSTCDLETGREFDSSTDNLGVRTAFYDLESPGGTLSTEGWLAELEGEAATIIGELASDPTGVLALSDQDENALGRFMAAQRFRVPSFRELNEQMRRSMVEWAKKAARAWLDNNHAPEEAKAIWQSWESQPDWWWLQEDEPPQDADVCTFMLGEVQGFANLFRAMPWRIAAVEPGLGLYTSDNPVSAYLPPTRPWWSGGALAEHVFFFPLSPRVLAKIGPISYNMPLEPKGARACETFSLWEADFARHVVTAEATRFLYGPGPYVSRECARSCLQRLNQAKVSDAMMLQGFNPNPPSMAPEEPEVDSPSEDDPDADTQSP